MELMISELVSFVNVYQKLLGSRCKITNPIRDKTIIVIIGMGSAYLPI